MRKDIALVVIDPQKDFCSPSGALYVTNAEQDMARVAAMVDSEVNKIDQIFVTMDSHHEIHIAHPIWWVDANGNPPQPFTIITETDVIAGVWRALRPEHQYWSVKYVGELAKQGKYPLCVWPVHCLVGSNGWTVDDTLFASLTNWERTNFRTVQYLTKGGHPATEHYSPLKADVPIPNDPTTQLNMQMIQALCEYQTVIIAGEAGSHCLANFVRDLVEAIPDKSMISRLYLLEDGTSPVPGFENLQVSMLNDMRVAGVNITTTTGVFKDILVPA